MNLIMKKELHELVYNPKTILNVFLMLVLPHIPNLKHSLFLYHIIIASSIFAGGQFIYDSFYNETSAGFVTIGISLIALSFIMSFDSILCKMLFSIVLASVSFFATYYLSNSTYYRSQL